MALVYALTFLMVWGGVPAPSLAAVAERIAVVAQADSPVASGASGTCPWELDASGRLTVHSGIGAKSSGQSPWYDILGGVRSVFMDEGVVLPEDCSDLFQGCPSLASLDLPGWDTSAVTDMSCMFSGCSSLTTLDLSGWDTSSVTDMGAMFGACDDLSSLDLSGWDTSAVTSAERMFSNCPSLSSLKVGAGYRIKSPEMFPDATNQSGKWWSAAKQGWYSKGEIVRDRSGVADTYTSAAGESGEGHSSGGPAAGGTPGNPPGFVRGTQVLWVDSEQNVHAKEKGAKVLVPLSVDWDDAWFHVDPTKYNHSLARATAVLSTAVYQDDAKLESGKALTESDFSKFGIGRTDTTSYGGSYGRFNRNLAFYDLDALGFDYQTFYEFYPHKDSDYKKQDEWEKENYGIDRVGLTFGIKWIDGGRTPLVAVLVRGTSKNIEWVSNFNVADAGITELHEGFSKAKSQVMDHLENWLSTVGGGRVDLSKAIFLVTGHSRGAAVANLVGHDLDDGMLENLTGRSDDSRTYVYTYATPNTSAARDLSSSKYANIFNIVNLDDVVTKVGLNKWGHGRYGANLALPSRSNTTPLKWLSLHAKMQEKFKSMTEGKGHAVYLLGALETDALMACFGSLVPNVKELYKPRPRLFGTGDSVDDLLKDVGRALGGKGSGPLANRLKKVAGVHPVLMTLLATALFTFSGEVLYVLRTPAAAMNLEFNEEFAHAHTQETYVSWLFSGGEEIYQGKYRGLKVSCPVDVRVYDPDGTLVCSIADNVVDEGVLASGVPAKVVGDTKWIELSGDVRYRVEIAATDSGTMDVEYEEMASGGEIISQVSYAGLPLEKGKVYAANALAIDDGMSAPQEIEVVTPSGAVIPPSHVSANGEVDAIVISTAVSEGEGDTIGDTTATWGDQIEVRAIPHEGYGFSGWYSAGRLVSDESSYTFRAESDCTLSARFAKSSGPADAGSPGEGEEAPSVAGATPRRLAGANRYDTMSAIADEGFSGSDVAVVASGANFPDALAASALAGAHGCPVLLTEPGALSPQTRQQLTRLAVRRVLVMGGETAVAPAVADDIRSMGISVERVAGADRMGTSVEAMRSVRDAGSVSGVIAVATGEDFADALSIGPWAWASGSPVVLTRADGKLDDAAVEAIRSDPKVRNVVIIGGTAAVSDEVRYQLGSSYLYDRLGGADRYETSALVARSGLVNGMGWSAVGVATGRDFPDALAASSLLGKRRGLLLLADGQDCPTLSLLSANVSKVRATYILGGMSAVGGDVEAAVAAMLE